MKKIILMALLATTMLMACGPRGNKPNVELIQDMMDQPAIKPEKYDEFFKGGISELVPPEHTQPVGFTPYRWGNDVDKAVKENKNPIAGQMTEEVLLTGQKYFETNCAACHGLAGHGDGPVAAKFPLKIPALVSDKVKGWPDAHIYHVITMGQGMMGSYASHVPQKYRWQVVNYVRQLQKQ
jgi:mono/diheme cytochrome c family protein